MYNFIVKRNHKERSMGGYFGQKENRQNRVDTGAFEAKHNRIIDNRDKINLNSREQLIE